MSEHLSRYVEIFGIVLSFIGVFILLVEVREGQANGARWGGGALISANILGNAGIVASVTGLLLCVCGILQADEVVTLLVFLLSVIVGVIFIITINMVAKLHTTIARHQSALTYMSNALESRVPGISEDRQNQSTIWSLAIKAIHEK